MGVAPLAALAGLVTFFTVTTGPACGCRRAIATGTVQGTVEEVGGPGGTPDRLVAGTVSFLSAGAVSTGTATRTDGTFALVLPVGRYRVEGNSPAVSAGAPFRCTAPPVTVQPRAGVTVTVVCPIK